jgi:hypothetical protein
MSTEHERPLPTCPHGVTLGTVSGFPIEQRCQECGKDSMYAKEREAIITYGSGWIDGYTGDELPEVAKALDSFLADIREMQHHV